MQPNISQLAFDALAILNSTGADDFAPTNAVRALPQFDALAESERERVNWKLAHLIDAKAKRGTPLAFAEFQATRTESTDLESDTGGSEFDELARGFVYMGAVYVEYIGGGEYMLTIGNDSRVSADLWELERRLYRWYCSEYERTPQVLIDSGRGEAIAAQLVPEQRDRRTALLQRMDTARAHLRAGAATHLLARYRQALDLPVGQFGEGETVHQFMAQTADAGQAEFDANTGGWVWVSYTMHTYMDGPARVRLLAIGGCDSVGLYEVPDDCASVRQFAEFIHALCGEDAQYRVAEWSA
jgi:hypothetical protein